jgi:opacity protein-like surface antigen
LKRHILIGCFAGILGLATMSHAQAIPTASRVGSIQAGVGGYLAGPDFGQGKIKGLTFYGDYDFGPNLGGEAEIHYTGFSSTDVAEDSYLFGPRYILRHKKIQGYAKALFGVGHFSLTVAGVQDPNTATYFEYALGGGVEYQATRHFNIRLIDLEAQKWPGFGKSGLSPLGGTIGVAYTFR